MQKIINLLFAIVFFSACSNELDRITAPDERVSTAVADLKNKLSAPVNGWTLLYQPTPQSGIFYMLMKFDEKGNVRIQSDVPGQDGYFYDQTIPYRIDTRLSLELIFETYGVLHYLFEQNSSTFGAEFEFLYDGETDGNLLFSSKSDVPGNETVITLVPAIAGADQAFSTQIAENLFAYDSLHGIFTGPMQQLVLNDEASLFWRINPSLRVVDVRAAAKGATIAEVISNNLSVLLDHRTGFSYFDGKLVLTDALIFTLEGKRYAITEITLQTFARESTSTCGMGDYDAPIYDGSISDIGPVQMRQTFFDVEGTGFVPQANRYSVNPYYVISADRYSLYLNGSIHDYYPDATGFLFNYGYSDGIEPAYAVGLSVRQDDGAIKILLREFDMTTTEGNKVEVKFNGNYYPSDISAQDQLQLEEITDEVFGIGGGTIYASAIEFSNATDLTIFSLYNVCTGYEFLLVQ